MERTKSLVAVSLSACLSRNVAGTILAAALLFSSVANAMQVPQFEKMADKDQTDYVTLLVVGAKNALAAHGHPDQAKTLITLFSDRGPSGGFSQFWKNLQTIQAMNEKNAADPNNKQPPYEVEHAMYLTLKENGITIPVSVLLTINNDFKPSSPPSSGTNTKKH